MAFFCCSKTEILHIRRNELHHSELTFNVIRIVDDKVSIPHYREIYWKVADIIALISILKVKTEV